MSIQLGTRGVHHVSLTVTDVARTRQFYIEVLGFQVILELGPAVLDRATALLSSACIPRRTRRARPVATASTRTGSGLDHLAFTVASLDELERAVAIFDEHGVPHGAIEDLGPTTGLPLRVVFFRDPDGIQLELSAPY